MRWIVPVVIIGLVGGMLYEFTTLHKIWCFLIGFGVLLFVLFMKSMITTARIMHQTKGKKRIWVDQNNNVVNSK